jgi:hypothetical protein
MVHPRPSVAVPPPQREGDRRDDRSSAPRSGLPIGIFDYGNAALLEPHRVSRDAMGDTKVDIPIIKRGSLRSVQFRISQDPRPELPDNLVRVFDEILYRTRV